MGDVFAQNGYRTALYGKWHLGGNSHGHMPHERGFQDALYYLRGGVQSHPNTWNSDLFDDVLYHNGKQKEVPGYATDVWFDHGTRFAKQCHKNNEPFFLYLPLNAPHGPLFAPDKFREPYRHLDKPTATFFAMIATVDYRLGEFVKMLEAEGMRDNTILGSAVVNHDNPNAAQINEWTEWNIDLQAFADQGVNLANVSSITLGLGNRSNPVAGGAGMMYFDDIRLYAPVP